MWSGKSTSLAMVSRGLNEMKTFSYGGSLAQIFFRRRSGVLGMFQSLSGVNWTMAPQKHKAHNIVGFHHTLKLTF